jgi:NAD(P)-dependent dehydrogenase (short-subunit alcohol dehydrogenase family)
VAAGSAAGASVQPEEVAAVAAFLASDDASYVTGQTTRWMAASRSPGCASKRGAQGPEFKHSFP